TSQPIWFEFETMADACQALGAATLWTIQRFAKAPEANAEAVAATTRWRFLPSVGTWVLPKPLLVAPAQPGKGTPMKSPVASGVTRKAPAKPMVGTTKPAANVPSPKIQLRRPRHTAPAISPVTGTSAAQKPGVQACSAAATEQRKPSEKTLLTKSASATLTRSVDSKASPTANTKAATLEKPATKTVRVGGKAMSTAEIEAQRIEEKRKQARFLAERNARRMNRLTDAPKEQTQKEQAACTADASTGATTPSPPSSAPARLPGAARRIAKPVGRPGAPQQKEAAAEATKAPTSASAKGGARIATAPTPTRNVRVLPQRKSPTAESSAATAPKSPGTTARVAAKPTSSSPRTAAEIATQPKMRPASPGAGVKKAPAKAVPAAK
ncbi:Klhdc8b, partial [Symbiodinium microadriaticum]